MSNKTNIKNKQVMEKAPIAAAEFDMDDQLAIDPLIKAEIEGKGLVFRWINAHKLKENFGFDSRRWIPYKPEVKGDTAYGFQDSEGYVRRGDLLLGVRSKEINAAHRAKIDRKNKGLAATQSKQAADELRSRLKDAGIKGAKIYDGYDEND